MTRPAEHRDGLTHRFARAASTLRTATLGRGRARIAGQLVYALGGVHGREDLLARLLDLAREDATLRAGQRRPVLLLCGDYVGGEGTARTLQALHRLGSDPGWDVYLLKGEREQGLLDFVAAPDEPGRLSQAGGAATLRSYGVPPPAEATPGHLLHARDGLLDAMPAADLRLLQTLPLMAVIGDYVFLHGGLPSEGRPADGLRMYPEAPDADYAAGKIVVHAQGQAGETPDFRDHRIGLNTAWHLGDVLTALRIEDHEIEVLQVRSAARPDRSDASTGRRFGWATAAPASSATLAIDLRGSEREPAIVTSMPDRPGRRDGVGV